ncbi:zinc finger MYM-type protein 2 isoform X3 [Sphaerodactylus townsendi]|uniref:zinc finger MYM-type protein 2 isoform X3 n=1 Tax=Sphaerodactylus townsendi TaxID=933632 RepID=UPI002027246E|nr:zinc finger MYM-type protein 2 isoform X3 [Sphaerodactylus townsendi]
MATGLANVGNSFGGPSNSMVSRPKFPNTSVEDDDDVVFIEPVQPPQTAAPLIPDARNVPFSSPTNEEPRGNDPKIAAPSKDLSSQKGSITETIIIDDEEDMETNQELEKNDSSFSERRFPESKNRTNEMEFSTPSFSRSKVNAGIGNSGITTEPDSDIQIANVTTLERGMSSVSVGHLENTEGRDMNLMITHVTSLQNTNLGDVSNGLQSSNFGVNIQTYTPSLTSQTKTGVGPFNPGRMSVAGDVFQNGESATHHNPDSWISQSASFPRNQKQPGVDSLSPVASLPKQVFQPPAQQQQQQPSKQVKVTCANCKKPLQKGQTAYQRKGSIHLFCSTTCLSSFSHKPAPKKLCVMCKKDITTMKGTIVAQVDSSESFQEFCSTSCLSFYEEKQNPSKGILNKSRCTICGKLTEIRHEVSFKNMTHKLCSDHCFNRYRMANGLIMNCCEHCGEYLPSKGAANNILMVDGEPKRFCCQNCVGEYKQALSVQPSNGQFAAPSDIQLKCNYCKNTFSSKPEVLEWENKVYQFCSRSCSDDYKKLHCIITYCEYCQEEKTLHEAVKFSGIKRPFCSEGCKLLYKQDFARRLGLRCVTCNYCTQLCKKGASKELDGVMRDFCSEECCRKFQDWYYKAARCDCCKTQGTLKEKVQWRGEMKHFCDQHCLLRFYCQQNEPNMATQKGPENLQYDQGCQTPRTKVTGSAPPPSPTPSKEMKNKAVLCKPLTMTKATFCKPHMQTKSCQTDDGWEKEYVPFPVPVPVYVPVPMHMYSQNVPVATTVPVPVPVPVFLPTTLDSSEKILEAIEELKNKIPSSHEEAKDSPVAEAEEEREKDDTAESAELKSVITEAELLNSETEPQSSLPDIPYDSDLDIEVDFPRATEELDPESEFLLLPVFGVEYEEQPRPRTKKKGAKRKAVSEYHSQDDSSENSECSFPFKYAYGVNAWKHWVKTRNLDEDLPVLDELKSTKAVKLKEDLVSHTPAELNFGLAHFVNEVRRPNGENYAPDSIYYLCLGIQEYLYGSNKKDNLFMDPNYHTFEQELNKILRSWQPSILPDGSVFSRVEEDYLWRIKQLGSHSPVALLNTLFYFNTKYFGLKTVEQHLRISFGTIYRHWKKNPLTMESKACLGYQVSSLCGTDNEDDKIASGKRKHEDDEPIFEQIENTADPSRCPVKMFECYLSKSPPNLSQRTDMFYLQPACPDSSDDPLWYTSASVDRNTLENMLVRVLLVKDIYDKDNYELDEDMD